MSGLLENLPNVVTGVLIIFVGYLLANVAQIATHTAASSADIKHPEVPARIARVLTFVTALIIGIEQAGINVGFLTNMLIVIVAVLLSGAALAFGLGARTLVSNIIGVQQFRRHVTLGERVRFGEIEGVLIETTQTNIILDTNEGRQIIPARKFLLEAVHLPLERVDKDHQTSAAAEQKDES
jgi:small-conductance mechanosensitive channel